MANKITIKDIAREAGVSLGSVHLALADKAGVSDSTRQRIKEIAQRLDYKPNILASNLKRETRTVAVALPKRDAKSRFYHDYMWNAIADAEAMAKELNLQILKLEYTNLPETLYQIDLSEISGLITVGYPEEDYDEAIHRVTDAGIPTILVDNDMPESGRMSCLQPDTQSIGELTGELLLDMIHRIDGKILVCGGSRKYPNHYRIVDAVSEYLEAAHVKDRVLKVYLEDVDQDGGAYLEQLLRDEQVCGCCSVNSRTTKTLAEALLNSGKAHYIPAIGNGLFRESAQYLKDGVLTALIDKRPYEQCYRAFHTMADLLAKAIQPAGAVMYVGADVVFRSNLSQYDKVSFRMIR
ncbi:MAG: LacI family DNA-binding transcriptional regulator [Lachnospiraceae bacterium]|nr:LacI family DNA-binding transcriptional regulator [Lachnospiraceae bacterium]